MPVPDSKYDEQWKQKLSEIRAGLPVASGVSLPSRRGETTRERKNREREVLLALCERQEWKCFWCGIPMGRVNAESPDYRSLEHVVARSSGLSVVNHLTNLRAACRACNSLRGEMTSFKQMVAQKLTAELQLKAARETIARHKVTMAGRCYWCKFRFHLLEWWKKRKAK